MKDSLKKYVDENRMDFDIYQQDYDELWNGIEKKLQQKRSGHPTVFKTIMRIAASILIVCTVAMAYYMGKKSTEYNKHGIALHNISSEMAETEAFYISQINEKIEYIKDQNTPLNSDIWESLEMLDKDYEQLKKDLKDNADSEKVIDAMINYYRLKLEMLEQISSELHEKDDENESFNI